MGIDRTNRFDQRLIRKPVGRAQVLKLRHTMDALLQRITIEDNDLHGQTQVDYSSAPSSFLCSNGTNLSVTQSSRIDQRRTKYLQYCLS